MKLKTMFRRSEKNVKNYIVVPEMQKSHMIKTERQTDREKERG